jgi:hypothetical protein
VASTSIVPLWAGGSFGPSARGPLHFVAGGVDTWHVEEAQELVRVGAATTVPLRRLGALLRDARLSANDDLAAVAGRSGGRFDPVGLLAVEEGDRHLTDDDVAALLALYGADPGELVAARSTLVIDLGEGTVAAGSWSTSLPPGSDDPDEVLARYLALLYEMRGLAPGTPIPLRTLDISVLANALALPAPAVQERLVVLMEPGDQRVEHARRLLSRRILVPAAGLVVAATAAGLLLFSPSAPEPTTGTELGRAVGSVVDTPVLAPEPDTTIASGPGITGSTVAPQEAPPGADEPELGDGLTIERDSPSVPTPPAADDPELGEALTIEGDDS